MSSNTVWHRNQQSVESRTEDELLVFGYSCKIFRDDEKANYIDEGKHLIPWMGDESLMIDRYDARGYLHDLTPYEAKSHYDLDRRILEEEKLCDEERYLALHSKQSEEELYHEEEMKRLRAAVASDGAYHEIGFSYDTVENQTDSVEQAANKESEPVEEPYVPPDGLEVPQGMHLPTIMKIHAIIEKTAKFISQQGGQMEIIIKMKQGDNPQFAFMNFDNPLHPYYKFLIQELKSGRYKPPPDKKVQEIEEEHNDDHYLHPSLMAKKQEDVPKFTVPSINFRRTGDDSYSLLVKNLKQRITEDKNQSSPDREIENDSPVHRSYKHFSSDSSDEDDDDDGEPYIDPPPPDIQPIIDKMAEYVAKNGEDFETIVKSKSDKRFDFLNEGHQYYKYYISKRNFASKNRWPHSVLPPPPPPPALQRSFSTGPQRNVPMARVEPPKLVTLSVSDTGNIITKPIPTPDNLSPSSVYNYDHDSTDITLSPRLEPKEILKAKHKVIGPISFSLRAKESEFQGENDSEGGPSNSPLIREQENDLLSPARKLSQLIKDEKARKLTPEELEARLAEEKLKDKIMAAAREKLAQQKREKQLQLERKQKAAVFLKMLQIKKMNEAKDKGVSNVIINEVPKNENNGSESAHSDAELSPDKKELITSFPPSPISSFPVEEQWSGSEAEEHEQNNSKKSLTLNSTAKEEDLSKTSLKKSHKSQQPSKSKKRRRSRSRSKSHSRSQKSSRNKSPPRKEKKLPSAYALDKKSRSRSRSPKRYSLHSRGRSPLHWSRYR